MIYNYVFSDMDGTLLDNSGAVSALNSKAINSFVQMGGYFSIATGRSETITRPYLSNIKTNFPAILYNGAGVYDFETNRFLHKELLSNAVVFKILSTVLKVYPTVCIEAFVGGPIKLLNPNGVEDHLMAQEKQPYIISQYADSDEYIKLLLYGEHSKLSEIYKLLAPFAKDQFVCIFSAPFYLEILPDKCSKGTALTWITSHFSLPRNRIAAIGDYDNDIEMLQIAALGAAPNNAISKVKEQADIIVSDNNHSAIADLIYSFVL